MKPISHIDIVEPERIDALLSDPVNFTWRAIDSETLDTWTPDLGVTNYPVPSIVRRGSVATSGVASTLRHRFWGTVEKQTDHTGTRYIGIVLYDHAGEECPLEVRLGADEIGRVEPTRHDNRRHLIVLDRAVDFVGEMEILQVTAPGRGAYRIEHFVLLCERPVASRFLPTIENLTTAAQPTTDGHCRGVLDFTTTQPATLLVTAHDGDTQICQAADPTTRTLHAVQLPGLVPDRHYAITVTATEKSGMTASATTMLSTATAYTEQTKVVVPVTLFNRTADDITGTSLTFGIPLPQGALYDPRHCQLCISGQPTQSAQIQVQTHWPDRSARWALIDTIVPPSLPGKGTIEGEVRFGEVPPPPPGLSYETSSSRIQVTNDHLRVCVQQGDLAAALSIENRLPNGEWRPLLPDARAGSLRFDAVLGDDLSLITADVTDLMLEEEGRQRAVIKFTVPQVDAAGNEHLRSIIRLHVYANSPFIKVGHRLAIVSPWLGSATRGLSPEEMAMNLQAREVVYGEDGEEATLLKLRTFAIELPWTLGDSLQALGSQWPLTGDGFHLRHEDDLGYRLQHDGKPQRVEGRTLGHFALPGTNTGSPTLHLGIRHFWQRYPKGVRISAQGIRVELFPDLTDVPLPGDEEAWHRLHFWIHEDRYLLKVGMALTNEILLGFTHETGADNGEADRWFAWLEAPPVVRPPMDYTEATQALAPIAAKTQMVLPAYEALVDQALASFAADREHFRAYGQLNFGDWYGESGWSWGNNEYDPAYCAYIEFLRGGAAGWATWGAEAVHHLVDVDTLNHSANPDEVGGQAMHMPGHVGGYLPPLFRSKMAGTKSIPSHTWVEGPLLHSLLTGDRVALDSIELTKAWLLRDRWFDHYEFSNCREAGWHLIHLCMLAGATNDRRCLNGAAVIVKRVLEREEPAGGWIHMLTESHCGCGYPRCRGEAGFMVGVLLSGLKRYHNLTGDERVAQAIIGGARWLIRATFDETSGHFRYTSCANRTRGGGFQQTQWVLEGLAAAYELSGDQEIGHYVADGLKSIGRFPEGLDHLGLGKAMSQQMRYVPTVLAALEKRPLGNGER